MQSKKETSRSSGFVKMFMQKSYLRLQYSFKMKLLSDKWPARCSLCLWVRSILSQESFRSTESQNVSCKSKLKSNRTCLIADAHWVMWLLDQMTSAISAGLAAFRNTMSYLFASAGLEMFKSGPQWLSRKSRMSLIENVSLESLKPLTLSRRSLNAKPCPLFNGESMFSNNFAKHFFCYAIGWHITFTFCPVIPDKIIADAVFVTI